MKQKKLLVIPVFSILAVFAKGALSQLVDEEALKAWGQGVGPDVIAELVDNRTWYIDWRGCMGSADCRTYWEFVDDGTVCARAIGATPEDKCADDGNWRIEENTLCWELSWLGGGDGYKSVCILIKEIRAGAFETTRAQGIGLPFFEFTLLAKEG